LKTQWHRPITVGAVALAAALACAACGAGTSSASSPSGGGGGAKLTSVTIAYPVANVELAPLWLGISNGTFAKYGLDVSLKSLGTSPVVNAALASGSVDYAVNTPITVLQASSQGQPVEAIADYVNGLIYQVMVSKQFASAHNITASTPLATVVKQFKGTTEGAIGVAPTSASDVLLEAYGVDPGTVHQASLASTTADVNALKSGQIDWSIFSAPATFQAQSDGVGIIVASDKNAPAYKTPQISLTLSANPSYAQGNAALTRKLVQAVNDALNQVRDNPSAAVNTVANNLPGFSKAVILQSIEATTWAGTTAQNAGLWSSTVDFNVKSGQLNAGSTAQEGKTWTNDYTTGS
jgi:NitT/TauT family transport system substrate-binding protein